MCTRIKIFCSLQGATKDFLVPKAAHDRANVCAHRKYINPCNSKKMFWGLFIRDDLYSVYPYLIFFSAPPDGASTEYRISNREFSDFLRCIIVNLCVCYMGGFEAATQACNRQLYLLYIVTNWPRCSKTKTTATCSCVEYMLTVWYRIE